MKMPSKIKINYAKLMKLVKKIKETIHNNLTLIVNKTKIKKNKIISQKHNSK